MDILEESSGNFPSPSALCSDDYRAEMMKTHEVEEIVRYIEHSASVRNLIERHSSSDNDVSSEEFREFLCPINDNDDIEVSLASLQFKMSCMRKFQGDHIPFHKFLQGSRKQSEEDSAISNCLQNPIVNPDELQFPVYVSSLFHQSLAKPLTYNEFMKRTFLSLSRLYEKSKTDLRGVLELVLNNRLPAHLEESFLISLEEVTTIEASLSNDFQEFFTNFSRCESLRRHFVDVLVDDLPLGFESFKREFLLCDYLGHLLGNSEYLADQIISLLYEHLEKKHELSSYSKRTVLGQNDA